MIALLAGHTPDDPGCRAGRHSEHYYNMMFAGHVRQAWNDINFFDGLVFHVDDGRSKASIHERIAMCERAGVQVACEIHHNCKGGDYASSFYRTGDLEGRLLSAALHAGLFDGLYRRGIGRWIEIGLPNENWPGLTAVLEPDYSAVLLEPAFLDLDKHQPYFREAAIQEVAINTAEILQRFWGEYERRM